MLSPESLIFMLDTFYVCGTAYVFRYFGRAGRSWCWALILEKYMEICLQMLCVTETITCLTYNTEETPCWHANNHLHASESTWRPWKFPFLANKIPQINCFLSRVNPVHTLFCVMKIDFILWSVVFPPLPLPFPATTTTTTAAATTTTATATATTTTTTITTATILSWQPNFGSKLAFCPWISHMDFSL